MAWPSLETAAPTRSPPYVDGISQFTFPDSGNNGVFDAANNVINFVNDDVLTGGEASGGVLDQVVVYDAPLSAAQVAALGGPGSVIVPEAGTVLLTIGGLAVLGIARRRFAR